MQPNLYFIGITTSLFESECARFGDFARGFGVLKQ
jgi:hypothetical protein